MGAFGVIIMQKAIDGLLDDAFVFFPVPGVAEAFFSENAVEPFNEGLLVLLVGSCRTDTRDMFFSIVLPFAFKLRPAIALDVGYGAKVFKVRFERLSAIGTCQCLSYDDTRFFGERIYGCKCVETAKVHRICLNDLSGGVSSSDKAPCAVFLPFAPQDEPFAQDAVDGGYGGTDPVFPQKDIPNLLATTIVVLLANPIYPGFDHAMRSTGLFSSFLCLLVLSYEFSHS